MKALRAELNKMFEENWCPKCGKVVQMDPMNSSLPGILAKQCTKCKGYISANFLESEDDMIDLPDDIKIMRNIMVVTLIPKNKLESLSEGAYGRVLSANRDSITVMSTNGDVVECELDKYNIICSEIDRVTTFHGDHRIDQNSAIEHVINNYK